jgi:uncharacterized protein DUF4129
MAMDLTPSFIKLPQMSIRRVACLQRLSKLVQAALPILLLSIASPGSSKLLNYETRVVRAAEQIERIKKDSDYSEEGVSYVKRLLPKSEEVEFDDRRVVVDNAWLHQLLDSYETENDRQQQLAKLNEAAGRLKALDTQLRAAESERVADSGDPRDQARQILSRQEYQPQKETPIGAFVKRVLQRVREVITDILRAFERLLSGVFGASAQASWISTTLIVLALLAAAIAIVRRIKRDGPRKRRAKKRLVLGEEVDAGTTARDLAEAATAAASAGDFRTAIRKLYVSLLYELSERNLLELEDHVTNHEYLARVKAEGVLAPMRYMTHQFDYVWYGMFPTSERDFSMYFERYREAVDGARIPNSAG